jgi:hypothetical protein
MQKHSIVETGNDVMLPLGSGDGLIIRKGARGVIQSLLPSYPSGPVCFVQFKITHEFIVESRFSQEDLVDLGFLENT